jgi:hypothetical protein
MAALPWLWICHAEHHAAIDPADQVRDPSILRRDTAAEDLRACGKR